MALFIPVTKIDLERRLIYGVAADETPDQQNEIFDYASNKPLWQRWSAQAAKATSAAGQEISYGNVRGMHGSVAAGKVAQMDFDDAAKSMSIVAKITDETEWEKAKTGTYTGFSVGGTYAKRWADPAQKGIMRVTIAPTEISLVDLPCNPSATYVALKADGLTENLAFAAKVAEREDVKPAQGKEKYGNVTFADEKNKKYPIDTPAHIRAAWNYIGKAKNQAKYSGADVDSIKKKIVAAWKDKIDKAGPPSAGKAAGGEAKKGLYAVATLAQLLDQLACLQQNAEMEAEMENDGSDMPEKLANAVNVIADALMEMAEEEIDELLDSVSPSSEPAQAE